MKGSLIISLIIGILIQIYYYSILPEYVANNFGSNGQANAWMTKELSLVISTICYFFNTLIFLSVPLAFGKLPTKYVSFPGKEYWLADERKSNSIPVMSDWMYFFGLVTNIFIMLVSHLVFVANMSEPVKLNESAFFTIIIVYTLIMIMWIISLYRRFNVKS